MHEGATSQEMLQIPLLDMILNIINLILEPHFPGANELSHNDTDTDISKAKLSPIEQIR